MKTFKAILNLNKIEIENVGRFTYIKEMIDAVVFYCIENNIIGWEINCTWMPSYTNNIISWRD